MKPECTLDTIQIDGKSYACTVALAMDMIGGKWKMVILYHLQDGPQRFGQLHQHLMFATEAVLSRQLKDLQRDGLISRTQTQDKPPFKSEYALTDLGWTLIPLLRTITDWGNMIATKKGILTQE